MKNKTKKYLATAIAAGLILLPIIHRCLNLSKKDKVLGKHFDRTFQTDISLSNTVEGLNVRTTIAPLEKDSITDDSFVIKKEYFFVISDPIYVGFDDLKTLEDRDEQPKMAIFSVIPIYENGVIVDYKFPEGIEVEGNKVIKKNIKINAR